MKISKIGIIGCGTITKEITPLLQITKGIKISALCDTNLDKAKQLQKKFPKAILYENYLEMVDKEKLDAVYVALPHFLHYPVLKNLIINKIDIFVEKPITTKVLHAIELSKLAEKHGVKIAVNYQYRYDKSLNQLMKSASSGELGQIYFGRCLIPWKRDESYFTETSWHQNYEMAGGGTLITQGSHMLDMLLLLFNSEIKSINGISKKMQFLQVEVEDFSGFTLTFKNGAILQFISTMVVTKEEPIVIDIYGKNGTAHYKAKFFSKVHFVKSNIKKHSLPIKGIHRVHKSIKGFRNWIQGGSPHLCTINDAIPVLKTIQKIYQDTLD